MSEKINTTTKIKVLLEGDLSDMNPYIVDSWFSEAFLWIESTERYRLGIQLMEAKSKWDKQRKYVSSKKITV